MGLLGKAIKKKKELDEGPIKKPKSKLREKVIAKIKEKIKPIEIGIERPEESIKPEKPKFKKKRVIKKEKLIQKKEPEKKYKMKKKTHPKLKPKVSLATGRIHLHKETFDKPDYSRLQKKLSKKGKSKKLDFAKVKKQIQKKIEVKSEKETQNIIQRIPTGIPGLDEAVEGGLIKDSSVLVGGGAGSGKTILCMQFLVNGIDQYKEPGIFISFEQKPKELLEEFQKFDWSLDKKIKQKQLVLLHFTPEEVNKFLESGGGIVRDTIESIKAKRIVIDSLTAFTLLFKSDLSTRKAVLQLFDSMAKWDVTALVTSEQEPDPNKHKSTIMEFEVDGVVLLYNLRKGDVRERSLEIFKMRSTQHSAKIFPMKIEDTGVTIYPEETVF